MGHEPKTKQNMPDEDKTSFIIRTIGIAEDEEESIKLIDDYLSLASAEIISWHNAGEEKLSPEFDVIHVFSVIAGYSQRGAEGQISHTENGLTRMWRYEDMITYIHNNVARVAKVL